MGFKEKQPAKKRGESGFVKVLQERGLPVRVPNGVEKIERKFKKSNG